ncbi:hypothetical protein P8935_05435 [Telmatobacter sp. DSM 110680]|uniref:Uncharacterized protein n=1 Tax=Telmatobacter sp. DSM 110680 TaxID=3036704 RepID=A0AAU7DNW6_9BACT
MRTQAISILTLLTCVCLAAAQTKSTPPVNSNPVLQGSGDREPASFTSELGFSYALPADWEIIDTKPMLPVVQQQAEKKATSEKEKTALSCIQLPFKATRGDSSVVIVALSFDCYGHRFSDSDLASFAGGVAQSLKKTWTVADPLYAAYALGTHSFWIERGLGTSIAHPEVKKTLDVVCSMLKNGAVCWMLFAADPADLQSFEHGAVSLDNDSFPTLVPATTFDKKPSN